jgi:hypothetical protein
MRPPSNSEERKRSRYFAPLRIFFADDPIPESLETGSRMTNNRSSTEKTISVADRRRLTSGCMLITLKATEKSPAFSLSKGK